ncbi:DUF433 domain-containing protein [Flavobacterium psychrophilum]|uniref:DUF433 domain-containing protein n=1 Tax=Flavobacterium psychrophilum TaxID=96345 RepID=UPI003B439146
MNLEDKLTAGKGDILYSQVLIKGKNVCVREVFRMLAHGSSEEEILIEFPELTKEDILTSYTYALELIGAIEFKQAMSIINKVVVKRNAILEKLDSLKSTNFLGKY